MNVRIEAAPTAKARQTAARGLAEVVDSKLFRALCEPARIDILRQLTILGRVDIGTLAERLPQDRSVISRHLAVLRDAEIVRREKRGRSVYFEVDGPAVVAQLEAALTRFRAIVPLCCPPPASPSGITCGAAGGPARARPTRRTR
jgi:DNA-binding transcriptional ArsR family regulator